jgi:hypothetical protein
MSDGDRRFSWPVTQHVVLSTQDLFSKSIHMTLVHSRSDFCLFLCGDVLDRRGDRRLIVEVG